MLVNVLLFTNVTRDNFTEMNHLTMAEQKVETVVAQTKTSGWADLSALKYIMI